MSKSLIDSILDSFFDEKWVGQRGEKLTERELKLVSLFGRKGKTLRNLYVPKDDGQTSEIDVVYITQKGIFVFESKNYSGWIFGDESSMYWTASLPNGQKNRFYNPVKQNRTHLKWVGQYVGENIPLFSIIVFSERCELKKVTLNSLDVRIIKRDLVYATVRNIWDEAEDALTDEQMQEIYNKLNTLTNADEAVKLAHIDNIKKFKEDLQKKVKAEDTKVCPCCGKELVLRTAKKGENAGKQFYGCSGFPNCRYTENL